MISIEVVTICHDGIEVRMYNGWVMRWCDFPYWLMNWIDF